MKRAALAILSEAVFIAVFLSLVSCATAPPAPTPDVSDPFYHAIVACPDSPPGGPMESSVLTCLNLSDGSQVAPCLHGAMVDGVYMVSEIACTVRQYGVYCAHLINAGIANQTERNCAVNAAAWIEGKAVSYK